MVNAKQIRSDQVQDALQLGESVAIKTLIKRRVIPKADDYDFDLNEAERQVVEGGVNYRFTGVLKSKCEDVRQAVSFIVNDPFRGSNQVINVTALKNCN